MFLTILFSVLGTALAIIAAEIALNYGLGDLVKDFAVRLFHGAEAQMKAQLGRAEARVANFRSKF